MVYKLFWKDCYLAMKIFNLFKRKTTQKEADRLYDIYSNVNIHKRVEYIAELEFKKMIFEAEKTALRGDTSFVYTLDIDDADSIYFNQIVYVFISKLHEENLKYARNLVNDKKRFTIYFSKPIDI